MFLRPLILIFLILTFVQVRNINLAMKHQNECTCKHQKEMWDLKSEEM